jgi:hypothetical protein
MSVTPRKIAIPLAIVVAVSAVPMLTGCFGNPVQGVLNAATGGKVNLGGGGLGGGSLPSDFPKSVPTYSGKIDTAVALGTGSKEVWNVTVEIPGSSTYNEIKSQLTGAGFKVEGSGNAGTSGEGLIASSKTYSVIVGVTGTGSKWVANYTVGPADSSN